jgi:hypothetical protein
MALQAEHVHEADFEKPRVGGTVGSVATAAAFGFHRYMLVNKRPLLIDMALVANGIAARQSAHLPDGCCSMWAMTVIALHQTLIDAMVEGLGEIGLGRDVAAVAQLGLALDQEVLFLRGVVRRVAIEAADIAAGVGGFRKMRLLATFAVASQAASAGLLP